MDLFDEIDDTIDHQDYIADHYENCERRGLNPRKTSTTEILVEEMADILRNIFKK
jgi:hypothetical protein